jgi:hypothetical protein
MANSGRKMYVPKNVIKLLEKIKKNNNLTGYGSTSEALKKMTGYTQVGMKVEDMAKNFSLGLLPRPKKKKKR